ncbi:MAG: hypothetical protein K0U37_04665 [Gammaproteobacteria bacterium]|nr:hypothetical protein [Gammaproteobacteria bacterium]
MPNVQKDESRGQDRNTFTYMVSDEALHPILLAVQANDVAEFAATSEALASVAIGEGANLMIYRLHCAGHLFVNDAHSVYGYHVQKNIAWMASELGHADMVEYMLGNRERLGLTVCDFIPAVNEANRRDSSVALKEVFEQHPDIINAYNKAMQGTGKQYQLAPSEPPSAKTDYLLLTI